MIRKGEDSSIDFDKVVAVGIKLPFGKPNWLFAQSFTTEEQATSNLKNLLLTRKGERPYQPLFGSDVYSLLFENIDLDLDGGAGDAVISAI